MIRLLTSLVLCVALTGCGEVVVFGHVVRENPAKTEAAAAKPGTEPVAPEPAIAAAATEPAAPKLATEAAATEPAAATPATAATAPASARAAVAATPEPATVAAASEPATVAAASEPATVAAASEPAHRLRAVNVTLSPASQAGDAGVDAASLADAIRTELRSRNLLDEQNPSADGTAEVLIESATTHATVNAVIFGQKPMAGTLTGELHVSSASGDGGRTSTIVAESRFRVADDGEGKDALVPLYRRFAVLTADELSR